VTERAASVDRTGQPRRAGARRALSGITVSTRLVRPLLERLRASAVDVPGVIAAAGASEAVLRDADARIPHATVVRLWAEAVRATGDEALGLHVAEHIRPGTFDLLEFAARANPTVGEGIRQLARYFRILHDAASVQLEEHGDRALLTHALPPELGALPRAGAEFVIGTWLTGLRQAVGRKFAPIDVRFRHPKPASTAEYERCFRAPVRFSQPINGITLPRSLLLEPLLRADPALSALLERYMREALAALPPPSSTSDRARHLLAAELPNALDCGALAARMGRSPRTLRRQLAAEATTFRRLFDELRRDLALRYLGDPQLAIGEIAFMLGFSEVSAFHRAFRRWRAMTPSEFRQRRTRA
jgi:AraC-like DNA-binding protein